MFSTQGNWCRSSTDPDGCRGFYLVVDLSLLQWLIYTLELHS